MVPKTLSFSRLLFAGLLLAGYASAESKWTYMHSEDLDVYSESTPLRNQETIRAFEQIRAFIVKSIAPHDGSLGPICVVAFKAEEDFAHFHQAKTNAISYAIPGTDRDYVVMGVPEADSVIPATRAYTEILSRQLGLNLPPWLDEGLTSFYATFTVKSGDVIAGDMTPERRKSLYNEAFSSLTPILSAPANSRTQLNQRFVLVHMLLLSKDYAPKFKDLVAALQSGTASQKALENVYGRPLADIEKDLKTYAVSEAFVGTPLATGSKAVANSPGEPASAFDVNLVLAGITNQPGRERDAEAWFDRLSTMSPERPEPWAGLGYIALRRNQLDVAEKNFQKAISLGSRDTSLLWAASRVLHRDSTKDTADGLRKLLDREPTRADLRVRLAALELDERRPGVAYSLLEPMKDVPTDLTARFLSELAYAQLGTGENSAAKLTVARLDDRASSATDKAEISRLRDFIAGPTHMTLGSKSSAPQVNTEELAAEAQRLAKEKELADAHDKELASVHDKELAAAREKEGAEAIEKATTEARLKAEARDKEKAEADQRAQAEQAARIKALNDVREKALADAQEKKDAKAREKADREAQTQAAADARQKAASEARQKALADAQEKQEAKAREKADAEVRDKAIQEAHLRVAQAAQEAHEKAAQEAHEKEVAEAREKAEADARLRVEARNRAEAEAKAKADADAKAKADADAKAKVLADAKAKADAAAQQADARQKAAQEPTVLAKAARETRASAEAAAQPQQASNLVSDSSATAHTFPSMLSGQFVELGCGDQIKVVVQTEQGKKNFRIKNPANVIVSGKSGGTVDLNCGPQTPSKVRIQYGPGESGFDGQVEAIYFE